MFWFLIHEIFVDSKISQRYKCYKKTFYYLERKHIQSMHILFSWYLGSLALSTNPLLYACMYFERPQIGNHYALEASVWTRIRKKKYNHSAPKARNFNTHKCKWNSALWAGRCYKCIIRIDCIESTWQMLRWSPTTHDGSVANAFVCYCSISIKFENECATFQVDESASLQLIALTADHKFSSQRQKWLSTACRSFALWKCSAEKTDCVQMTVAQTKETRCTAWWQKRRRS